MSKTRFNDVRKLLTSLPSGAARRSTGPELVCGPCVVESRGQLETVAAVARDLGACALRGGGFKLRTDVTTFHGLGFDGWTLLREVSKANGLAAISEITSVTQISAARECLDILQIGARSMWNFDLLEAAAKVNKPIVLKRGLGSTTEDWLQAAARVFAYGAEHVILCERGSSSDVWPSRNAVDFSTLLMLAEESPLPVWLDVSHSAGDRAVVSRALRYGKLLPIDGIMVEVHPEPPRAMCDAEQALDCADLLAAWR